MSEGYQKTHRAAQVDEPAVYGAGGTKLMEESPGIVYTILAGAFLAKYLGYHQTVVCLVILLLIFIMFYRHFPIESRYEDHLVVSPAYGVLTHIQRSGTMTELSIYLSPWEVHTQCYPMNGRVLRSERDETGKFALTFDYEKTRENEKVIHHFEPNIGCGRGTVTQIAGFLPRRIVAPCRNGSAVEAGEYLGMIKFGSRVDLCIPTEALHLNVKVGDHIDAGQIIGEYYLMRA